MLTKLVRNQLIFNVIVQNISLSVFTSNLCWTVTLIANDHRAGTNWYFLWNLAQFDTLFREISTLVDNRKKKEKRERKFPNRLKPEGIVIRFGFEQTNGNTIENRLKWNQLSKRAINLQTINIRGNKRLQF